MKNGIAFIRGFLVSGPVMFISVLGTLKLTDLNPFDPRSFIIILVIPAVVAFIYLQVKKKSVQFSMLETICYVLGVIGGISVGGIGVLLLSFIVM